MARTVHTFFQALQFAAEILRLLLRPHVHAHTSKCENATNKIAGLEPRPRKKPSCKPNKNPYDEIKDLKGQFPKKRRPARMPVMTRGRSARLKQSGIVKSVAEPEPQKTG